MNKNWYAVYTKAQCEKKVASLLTKKKIESYCPFSRKILNTQNNRKKIVYEPLFPFFVFVYITPAEMSFVKQTSDVINFVYWLGKPAIIKSAEIENIDSVINSYYNVKLEKTVVNPNGTVRIHDEQGMDLNLEPISTETTQIKITLPSLGYIMVTDSEKISTESFNYAVEKITAFV
jgi:transcription antitermination factor NusG